MASQVYQETRFPTGDCEPTDEKDRAIFRTIVARVDQETRSATKRVSVVTGLSVVAAGLYVYPTAMLFLVPVGILVFGIWPGPRMSPRIKNLYRSSLANQRLFLNRLRHELPHIDSWDEFYNVCGSDGSVLREASHELGRCGWVL